MIPVAPKGRVTAWGPTCPLGETPTYPGDVEAFAAGPDSSVDGGWTLPANTDPTRLPVGLDVGPLPANVADERAWRAA